MQVTPASRGTSRRPPRLCARGRPLPGAGEDVFLKHLEADADGRKATQAISAVFALLMSSWNTWKDSSKARGVTPQDLTVRVAVLDALGHLSLVIPKAGTTYRPLGVVRISS